MDRHIELRLPDEAATARLGEDLALALRPGDVLALSGDLGAGKTSLARALIRCIADDANLEVPSPTFTLVQTYEARIEIHHFDLYRLESSDELAELGFDQAIAEGVALIEWPERAEGRLPPQTVTVSMRVDGNGRQATISGSGNSFNNVARSLAIRDFLAANGWGQAVRRHLLGDASARSYETVCLSDKPMRIVMNSPRLVLGPPLKGGRAYAEIAHSAQTVSAFVAIDGLLDQQGVKVPSIYASDLERGFLLIEHLGDEAFLDRGMAVSARYLAAAELLADMHGKSWPTALAFGGAHHVMSPFDRDAMMIEVELLTDWYLPYMTGGPASQALKAKFQQLWDQTLDKIADTEISILLRDFHSPNIIWRGDRTGHDRLGIIDFQDAMIGPSAYDLASLALDARVTITPELEAEIVAAYTARRRSTGAFDDKSFAHAYAVMATHRNSKILGGFVRLDRRDGKPYYLKHLPRIRDYVRRGLSHPSLAGLRSFYEENGLLDDSV